MNAETGCGKDLQAVRDLQSVCDTVFLRHSNTVSDDSFASGTQVMP